jgi:hypothetical protein
MGSTPIKMFFLCQGEFTSVLISEIELDFSSQPDYKCLHLLHIQFQSHESEMGKKQFFSEKGLLFFEPFSMVSFAKMLNVLIYARLLLPELNL